MRKVGCWVLLMVWLAGCNTVHGIGQDIEKGGEKVKDAASSVQKKM
jgi:entericidin B